MSTPFKGARHIVLLQLASASASASALESLGKASLKLLRLPAEAIIARRKSVYLLAMFEPDDAVSFRHWCFEP